MNEPKASFLRRYTELPFLFHLLQTKKLTLLDPSTWDDKNDSHYIELYRKNKKYKSVLALCFTEASETYHHWKIYSGNSSGVCIEFDKEKLLDSLSQIRNLKQGSVKYKTINTLKQEKQTTSQNDLLFLKRCQFRDEKEFRLIYTNKKESGASQSKDIIFDTKAISKIIINPWLHKSVFTSVKAFIYKIDGCSALRVNKTTLTNNDQWKKILSFPRSCVGTPS